jgi:hypothetical protein
MGRLKMPFPKNKKLGGEKKKMNTKGKKKYTGIILAAIVVCAVFAMAMPAIVRAGPQGAGYDEGATGTFTKATSGTDAAKGGYISEANLSTSSQTTKWQGYYGNVSGHIALEDASGNEMYNWTWAASNGGEVFAVARASVPTFTDVDTNDITAANVDTALTTDGTWSGTGSDSVAITFGGDNDNSVFYVSGQTVGATSRNKMNTLKSSGGVSAFEEVILTDQGAINDVSDMIWTCLINDNAENFKGTTSDYQMIVPTTDSGDATVTYYFYVELA